MTPAQMPDQMVTERLTLRPYEFADVDDLVSVAADPEWARFLPIPQPYQRVHAQQFVAKQVLLDRTAHCSWAICLDGTLVGGINIRFSPEHSLGELGYSIRRDHWGQGLATEAVSAVVHNAFRGNPDLGRIRAMADTRNTASQRVLAKCKFLHEGTLRQNRVMSGAPVDEAWFGILRSEWTEA